MNQNDLDYHLYVRPAKMQAEAERERLINRLKQEHKGRKRKPNFLRGII